MASSQTGHRWSVHFRRQLLGWKRPDIPPAIAVRNSLAIVLPLVAGAVSGHLSIGSLAASGALNIALADRPGPYRQRLEHMLLATLGVTLSAFTGFLLGGSTPLLVVAIAVWAFCCAMLVCLGQVATRVGLSAMLVLIITSAHPPPFWQAVGAGVSFLAGSLLATLFAIAAWPLQTYRPERHAIATVYRQLSDMARRVPPADDASIPVIAALTETQNLLLGRHHAGGRAMEAFLVLIQLAAHMRLELFALTSLHDKLESTAAQTALRQALRQAAVVLRGIALALHQARRSAGAEDALPAFEAALERFEQAARTCTDTTMAQIALAQIRALAGQIRAATRNSSFASPQGEERAALLEQQLPPALQSENPRAILRANLSWSSVAFRHAVRCTICLVLAELVTRLIGLPQGYWVAMTTAIVLKPDFGLTFNYVTLRMLGTLLGLGLATALIHLVSGHIAMQIALIGISYFLFRLLVSVHYGIAVVFMTVIIVTMLSLSGYPPGEVMVDRGLNTMSGCALAALAYALWPSWERGREHVMLARLLDAHGAYLRAVLAGDGNAIEATRRHCHACRTNALASLERLRSEPRSLSYSQRAEAVLINAARFVRAALLLEAVLRIRDRSSDTHPPDLLALADATAGGLCTLADSLRRQQAPPPLPDLRRAYQAFIEAHPPSPRPVDTLSPLFLDTLDRMINCVNMLARILADVPQQRR